ncbi:hypothetical protein FGRMN_1219 [Fusarium graminum]|nr:hypothetical protein FGRMN_1219 [Fusarium graminum]
MFLLIILNLILLTTALPAPHYQYIGCMSLQSSPTFTARPLTSPVTVAKCIQACAGKATLVAIGDDTCFCDQGGASASFELVDEKRCSVLCVPGDQSSGKCGGQGVLSLYQISGCERDCNSGKNGTVLPVVPPSPCTLCDGATSVPTPTTKVKPQTTCPPEGCKTLVTVPISTPVVSNATAKICPSGGCSASGQGGQAGKTKTPSGEGSYEAAPRLASESPRLYTASILSAIAAVIFGVCLV